MAAQLHPPRARPLPPAALPPGGAGPAPAPVTIHTPLPASDFGACRIAWDERPAFAPVRLEQADAFLACVLRRAVPANPYWVDGRPVEMQPLERGRFALVDLRREHAAEVQAATDCVAVHLPLAALSELAQAHGAAAVQALRTEPGAALDDPVVRSLSESLVPALERPHEAHPLFVAHVGLALGWHMIHRYGETAPAGPARRGGLAAWQERLAKEMLAADVGAQVTLEDLAAACRLSRSHFARAFKASTGLSPHQWLVRERLRRAKALLAGSSKTMEAIAAECGFADQSHFTRVFAKAESATPARWRRDRRG